MHPKWQPLRRALWLLVAAGGIAGCSTQPTAPIVVPGAYSQPEFLRVTPSLSATTGPRTAHEPIAGSADVDGSDGGSLCVDRFRLDVPPGAFSGTARFTIEIPDPTVLVAKLTISKPDFNRFDVPVRLTVDCSDAVGDSLKHCGTMRLDEAEGLWYVVPSTTVDVGKQEVLADLEKFSTYGVASLLRGKAGW